MEQKRVLVIEDSPYLSESLVDMLEIAGHHATVAPNGRKGINMALEMHPDLILLDIRLPDINGYQVFQAIRDDEWGKTAKITILTASETTSVISKNISVDPKYVLFKPDWSIKALTEHINSRLAE